MIAPALAVGATALSGLTSAAGSIMSAGAQAQSARYQEQVAQQNATQSRNAANVALAQGDAAVQQQYQIGSAKQGQLRAALGADNIQLNNGSALIDQTDLSRTTAQNVQNTQYNADVGAVTALNQGTQYTEQASVDAATASNASTAGLIGAGTSLLGAASQVSGKWSWMQGGSTPAPAAANPFDGPGLSSSGVWTA